MPPSATLTGVTSPIIPGPDEPYTLASVMPDPPPRQRSRWTRPIIIGAAVLVAVVGLAVLLTRSTATPAMAPTRMAPDPFQNSGKVPSD